MAGPGDILGRLLADLRDFVSLLAKLVNDDEYMRDTFGFTVDLGLVQRLDTVVNLLDEASNGDADLAEYAEAAGHLVEVTEFVNLIVEAAEADLPPGTRAQEVVGAILDTVGLSYVSAKWPWLLYLARTLGMLTDNLPDESTEAAQGLGTVGFGFLRIFAFGDMMRPFVEAWHGLSGPLDTDEDARRLSVSFGAVGLLMAFIPPLLDLAHKHIDPRTVQVLYGWDPDPASATPVADRISRRFVTIMLRLFHDKEHDDHLVTEDTYELTITTALVPREHGGPGIWFSLGGGAERDIELGGGWHFVVDGDLSEGLDMMIPGLFKLGSAVGGTVEFRVERRDEGTLGQPAQPWRLGEVLEVRAAQLAVRLSDREPMLSAVLRIRDAALVIPEPKSGFFRSLLPAGGLRIEFDLGIVADSSPRVRLEGGSGLEVLIPVHTSTPRLQGLHVYLALRSRPDDAPKSLPAFTFEASGGFGTKLGAFTAVVDRFGIVLPRALHGPSDIPWLKFPSAIGIGIDGKLVRGGGFILFDPEHGRYAGALTLTIGRWTLTAFGLLTDLEQGYSLLLVMSVVWEPPLSGPFGIGLVGIGGILGHNHGVKVEALQAAVRTGAVRTMLFPDDPIAAAPRVLTTLGNVFPVQPGSSLIGIGLQLTWADRLVSLVAAVVIESGPASRVVVLASLLMTAPTREDPIVRIQLDGVGIIDSNKPSVEIDGSIVDSYLGPYVLTGDMVFRCRGGDEGLFLLAIGGFHPAYTPPTNANLLPQRRIALALPMENPRVRMELYVAVTSNSLQLGARLEVSARKAGFSAEAVIGFDALVQRDPFHLTVDIEARAAIRYEGSTLAEVGLDLHLDGPDPWHLFGKARLSLLFFSISIPIDTTFGEDSPQQPPPTLDAAAALVAALGDPAAWETSAPVGSAALVSIRSGVTAGELAAHPAGRLGARQDVLPLGIELSHVGRARVAVDRFDVLSVTVNGSAVARVDEVRAPFAAGEFVDLSDDERLSRPAFERFVAGFSAGSDVVVAGPSTAVDLSYEQIVLGPDGVVEEPPRPRPPVLPLVLLGASFGPAGVSVLRREEAASGMRAAPGVRLSGVTRVAVAAATLRPLDRVPVSVTDTELRQSIATLGASALLVFAHEAAEA